HVGAAVAAAEVAREQLRVQVDAVLAVVLHDHEAVPLAGPDVAADVLAGEVRGRAPERHLELDRVRVRREVPDADQVVPVDRRREHRALIRARVLGHELQHHRVVRAVEAGHGQRRGDVALPAEPGREVEAVRLRRRARQAGQPGHDRQRGRPQESHALHSSPPGRCTGGPFAVRLRVRVVPLRAVTAVTRLDGTRLHPGTSAAVTVPRRALALAVLGACACTGTSRQEPDHYWSTACLTTDGRLLVAGGDEAALVDGASGAVSERRPGLVKAVGCDESGGFVLGYASAYRLPGGAALERAPA